VISRLRWNKLCSTSAIPRHLPRWVVGMVAHFNLLIMGKPLQFISCYKRTISSETLQFLHERLIQVGRKTQILSSTNAVIIDTPRMKAMQWFYKRLKILCCPPAGLVLLAIEPLQLASTHIDANKFLHYIFLYLQAPARSGGLINCS